MGREGKGREGKGREDRGMQAKQSHSSRESLTHLCYRDEVVSTSFDICLHRFCTDCLCISVLFLSTLANWKFVAVWRLSKRQVSHVELPPASVLEHLFECLARLPVSLSAVALARRDEQIAHRCPARAERSRH